jgi:hypothetical protein
MKHSLALSSYVTKDILIDLSFPQICIKKEFMAQSSRKSEDQPTTKYCCVTCGTATDELSHHYKEGVIKIIHCVR